MKLKYAKYENIWKCYEKLNEKNRQIDIQNITSGVQSNILPRELLLWYDWVGIPMPI